MIRHEIDKTERRVKKPKSALSAVVLTADRAQIWLPGTDSNRRPSD